MNDQPPVVLDCGKSIDDVNAYLDAGRIPYDPSIETCPECLNAIEVLARVGRLSRALISDDAVRLPAPPEAWFQRILATVQTELHSGRDLPLPHPDPRVTLSVTEGAVRALLRATGDDIDGLYVGRTELVGDAETPGAPIEINLTATVAWGLPIPGLVDTLRERVYAVLAEHTDLTVTAVNIIVEDVHGYDGAREWQ